MAAVVGRAWSCVRGRACAVVHAWSWCVVVSGRARSCAVVRGRVRGRARSVVPFCPLRGQHCRDTNERTKEGTNERTTYNNPLNPPGVGWVKFVYPIKVTALNIKLLEPLAQGASRFEKLLAPRKIYWPPFFPDRRLYS